MLEGVNVRVEFDNQTLKKAVQKSGSKPLTRAGAYIRKSARNAVSRSKHSSLPGKPPHTRCGLLKRSILFGVEKERMSVVIGPAESFIGISMTAHEFGGVYRKRKYPKRSLMGPTLINVAPKLPKLWENSIKP